MLHGRHGTGHARRRAAVNFLSHDWLLGDGLPPLAHVGVSLPDLWPLLPKLQDAVPGWLPL